MDRSLYAMPRKSREDTEDDALTNHLGIHVLIVPRKSGYTVSVTVGDGMNRATGRILPGLFPTEALAWHAAIGEGTRILNRMFEERDRLAYAG